MTASRFQYPADARRCGLWGRTGSAVVRTADRLGPGAAWATRVLARHALWGSLQSGQPHSAPPHRLLALSFDLDYQADTEALPGLLCLLSDAGVSASLVSIGQLVDQDPGPYREAVAAGHEIVNHTWSHPDNPVLNPDREFWDLTLEEMTDEIGRAQEAFDVCLGVRPTGFRSPHFKDAPRMVEALQHVPEITYASSALATQTPTGLPYFLSTTRLLGDLSHLAAPVDPRDATDLLMIPLTPCPEHRWTPFDTWHALRQPSDERPGPGHHTLSTYPTLWQRMLRRSCGDGYASVYLDPMDVMRSAATRDVFADLLATAQDDGWQIIPLGTFAERWRGALRKASATPREGRHRV